MDRGASEVGPSGFRNVEPMSRDERATSRDKDYLEKARIQSRRRGVLEPPANHYGSPVVPPRDAPSYCGEYDRFNRNVAGVMHETKQQSLQKKEEVLAVKRTENYQRERSIWAADNAMEQREATRYETARNTGTGARRNQPGESYNIITLNYSSGAPGQALAQQDNAVKEKRQERAANLYFKGHSVSHNIITGEPIKLPVPAKQQR